MAIRIGWGDHYGRVEAAHGEHIDSVFLTLNLLPIAPLRTVYHIDGEQYEIHAGSWKSVLLGYLRAWTLVPALVLTLCAVVMLISIRSFELFPAAMLPAALFCFSYTLGGVSAGERARRAILKESCGVGTPPELLPHRVASRTYGRLVSTWNHRRREWGQRARWEEAIALGTDRETMKFLYTLACYRRFFERDELSRKLEEHAWTALQSETDPTAPNPELASLLKVNESGSNVALVERSRQRQAIKFTCHQCAGRIKVPASLAGRKGRCPKCRAAVRVPRPQRELETVLLAA